MKLHLKHMGSKLRHACGLKSVKESYLEWWTADGRVYLPGGYAQSKALTLPLAEVKHLNYGGERVELCRACHEAVLPKKKAKK